MRATKRTSAQLALLAGCLLGAVSAGATAAPEPPRIKLATASAPPSANSHEVSTGGAEQAAEREEIVLQSGQNLIGVLVDKGIERAQARRVAGAFDQAFDTRRLRAGQALQLILDDAGSDGRHLRELRFRHDIDREVVVRRTRAGSYSAEARTIPHERHIAAKVLTIEHSFGASASAAGIPDEIVAAVAHQLAHRVDFRRDLRAGDQVGVTYERFLHPEDGLEHTGALLSVHVELRDSKIEIFRFKTPDGIASFFDSEGVSIETMLARTPVVGGTLTSSYGRRKHPLLKRVRMHRGLDFSAPRGAPVIAVDAGRIARAGRYGSFGNYVRISHGDGLSTAYAHLGRYAEGIEAGVEVEKGQIIGYVGASGLATGPSLHYEVLRNGKQVDPWALDLPPRLQLEGAMYSQFRAWQAELREKLSDANQEGPPLVDEQDAPAVAGEQVATATQ